MISYMRAGASCLPIIGPFVGLYNALEVNNELYVSRLEISLANSKHGLIGARGVFAALARNREGIEKAIQEIDRERTELKNKYLPVNQKGRFYAICGIVGSVLSGATVVGLIAFGILGIVPSSL